MSGQTELCRAHTNPVNCDPDISHSDLLLTHYSHRSQLTINMNQYYTTNTDIYHIPPPPNEKDEAIIMLDKMIKCRAKTVKKYTH